MVTEGLQFFVWFDPDKRYKQQLKLEDAIAAYTNKLGQPPQEVFVNVADADLASSIPVRFARFVRPNHFYLPYPQEEDA